MKTIASIAFMLLIGTGCSTVQGVSNKYADKIPGARTALDAFRRAEGASMGMVTTQGKNVQTICVDKDGVALTNGVFMRMVLDEQIVAPAVASPSVVPLPSMPAVVVPPTKEEPQATVGDALDAIGSLQTK